METHGVVVQTFKVPGVTPRAVVQWYVDHLRTWKLVTSGAATQPTTPVEAAWVSGGSTLTISAGYLFPSNDIAASSVRYNLNLSENARRS